VRLEVHSTAEGVPRPGDDDDIDAVVGRYAVPGLVQRIMNFAIDCILCFRSIQAHECDPILGVILDDCHLRPPLVVGVADIA